MLYKILCLHSSSLFVRSFGSLGYQNRLQKHEMITWKKDPLQSIYLQSPALAPRISFAHLSNFNSTTTVCFLCYNNSKWYFYISLYTIRSSVCTSTLTIVDMEQRLCSSAGLEAIRVLSMGFSSLRMDVLDCTESCVTERYGRVLPYHSFYFPPNLLHIEIIAINLTKDFPPPVFTQA